jgi:multidomain signaling protein FimX
VPGGILLTASAQIRLVVITASQNDAERIESHLRNTGLVVRTDWVSDIDQLDPLVAQADLVLCTTMNLPRIKLKEVVERCNQETRRVPVIGMNDAVDVGRTTQAMRAGARDLVSLQQMEHLQAVLLRELEHVQTTRKLQEVNSRLQQAETRHESLLQDSTEALAYIQEGIHIRVNPAYAKLFGFTDLKSVEGLPLMDLIMIEDRPRLKQHLRHVTRGQHDKPPQSFQGLGMDGKHFPISVRFTPTQMDDEDCIEVLVLQEQPAAPSVAAGAGQEAPVGGFTGGHGRQSLYTTLDAALKSAEKEAGMPALMFLRVDNMERVEQRLGFDQADRVFNELAAFILGTSTPTDHSFRFSSSEFVLLTNQPDMQKLEAAAKSLQAAVSSQALGGKEHPTSLTISIAVLPLVWHSDTQEILREARQQVANLQSRQGSGIYLEVQRDHTGSPQQQEKAWVLRIKDALENNKFRLVHKAIVNLEGESSHLMDVLVRMIGDKGEEIQPVEFVPIAERNGLMFMIDQWVVLQALLNISSRNKPDLDEGLFLRLSENTLVSADKFLPWLLKQIKGYPVRPDALFLTFSETNLLDNMVHAKQLFSDLKKLKIRTAISHFGVSPQAIQLLEQLPVDFVRLDAAVIKALINPKAGERVSETLRQARQKGVRIVAKQVTDAQTMAMLWTLGVHFIEGDYVKKSDLAATLPP